MNANEVIATLASRSLGRRVHPNDHVNASQSSNDVFPTAISLAATRLLVRELIPALEYLGLTFERKAAEFDTAVKVGRTHLMDAVPVTLGQEFGGYAAAVHHGAERAVAILPRLGELPLGGTATGTGLNAPPGFAAAVIARLADDLELPLTEARNHFEAAGRDIDPGPAAGLVDHAGQGEPGHLRGGVPGVHAGDRERRGRGVRRRGGELRAERDDAGDRAEPARVRAAAGRRGAAARRPVRVRDHS
jgi:fumarate hydratase class II